MSIRYYINILKDKSLGIVVVGNMLDYYDFLLFAHLGYIITPLFIPNLDDKTVSLLSLILFSLPFFVRPLGGYIFGIISDKIGRQYALSQSIKWTGISTLGFVFLPSFEQIGILSSYLFILLRILQGMSLGGEYPTAGTYLMERYSNDRGFISAILASSGSVGGLIAFMVSVICLQKWSPEHLWRFAFLMGAISSLYSYYIRNHILTRLPNFIAFSKVNISLSTSNAIFITVIVGVMVAVTLWLPITYSKFYLINILHADTNVGLYATLTSILTYILLTPILSTLSDRFSIYVFMTISAFIAIPLNIIGFYILLNINIESDFLWQLTIAQITITLIPASFGGPIHFLINSIFNTNSKSRFLNLSLMTGLAIGSSAPALCGYVSDQMSIKLFPAILTTIISVIVGVSFYIILMPIHKKIN